MQRALKSLRHLIQQQRALIQRQRALIEWQRALTERQGALRERRNRKPDRQRALIESLNSVYLALLTATSLTTTSLNYSLPRARCRGSLILVRVLVVKEDGV
jgi:hypothetical protein